MTDPDPRPRLLLALTGAPYEEDLLAELGRPAARLLVGRRCLDVVDLVSAAVSAVAGGPSYAVVWPGLHRLDRETVARLAAAGVVTGAVAAPAEADHLLALGVAWVVAPPGRGPDGPRPADVVDHLLVAVRGLRSAAPGRGYSVPPGPWPQPQPTGTTAAAAAATPRAGRLVAVWGPPGAPGRTTVALALADELARAGSAVVLADADTYAPSVAQRLGMLDESSGLAEAVRLAAGGAVTPQSVAPLARTLPSGVRVLSGLTRPDRWPELRPASLSAVWAAARLMSDVVVVDCGSCLDDDEELAYDSLAPRRNGAAIVTVDEADVVVAVGVADAVGLQRLVRGLADLRERRPGPPPRVVVTQVRRSAVGRDPAGQVLEVLRRHAGVDDAVIVPDDRPSFDRALADARPLADVAPSSPARPPLRALALALLEP